MDIDKKYAEALLFTKDKNLKVPGGIIPLNRDETSMDEAKGMLDAIYRDREKNRKANEKSKVVPKGFKFGN